MFSDSGKSYWELLTGPYRRVSSKALGRNTHNILYCVLGRILVAPSILLPIKAVKEGRRLLLLVSGRSVLDVMPY